MWKGLKVVGRRSEALAISTSQRFRELICACRMTEEGAAPPAKRKCAEGPAEDAREGARTLAEPREGSDGHESSEAGNVPV